MVCISSLELMNAVVERLWQAFRSLPLMQGFSPDSATQCSGREETGVPSLQDGYYVDDLICQYRANVLGFYVRTSAVTVMARQASGNMSSGGNDGSRGYTSIMRLEKFNDKYSQITYEPLARAIEEISAYMKQSRPVEFGKSSPFFHTLEKNMAHRRLMQTYWRKGTLNRLRIRRELKLRGVFSLMRCLPMPVFAALLSMYRFLRRR